MSTELAILTQIKKNQAKGDLFSYSTDTTLPVEYEDKEINIIPEANDLKLKLGNLSDGMNKLKLKNISDIDAYILDNSEELLTIIKSQGKIDLHVNNGEFYSSNSEKLHDNLDNNSKFDFLTSIFDVAILSENKAIICYQNDDYNGTARIINISGTDLTLSDPYIFRTSASSVTEIKVISLTEDRAIVCYRDSNDSRGYASNLNISGNSIIRTYDVNFESGYTRDINLSKLSDDKAIVCYQDNDHASWQKSKVIYTNNHQTALYAGPEKNWMNNVKYLEITTLSETKAIVCYQDYDDNYYFKSRILNISDTTVILEDPITIETSGIVVFSIDVLSETKAIVCYQYQNNGRSRILDISGSTITPGNPEWYNNQNMIFNYNIVRSLSADRAIVCYKDYESNYNKYSIINISGSTITIGDEKVFNTTEQFYYNSLLILNKYKPFFVDSLGYQFINFSKFAQSSDSVTKSVQYGEVAVTNLGNTVDISPVDTNKSVLFITGYTGSVYRLRFENESQIYFQSQSTVAVSFCVVEYN